MNKGARVVAIDVDAAALARAYDGQESVRAVAVDLTDARATDSALEGAGRVDVLCNIAGGFDMGPAVHESSDGMWRRLLDLNVATLINASRALVPAMLVSGGRIVNVAAASANSGKAGMGAYCAAKDAVARLTEAMAIELREQGIGVNAVAPSIIDTPANRAAMPDADPSRWVAVSDLVSVIDFLASPTARAVNGAIVPVVGLS
ncbi:Sorbitol dehydrogenase [compost metagenome]